jgi:hypothetical protein
VLHLLSCLFFGVAHVDAAWGYMFLVDIPMSVIILAIAYNFDHPMILFGILGTLWWYLLSRAADMVIRWLRAKETSRADASTGRAPDAR